MELLGIALSVPAAFIASLTYCLIIAKVVRRFDRVSRVLWWLSGGVLTWFVLEVLLLLTLGAVRARTMMDPAFYRAHLSVFFLGAPALANVLLLRRGRTLCWYIAVLICTMFAFLLVLLQYGVSEDGRIKAACQ